MRFCLWDIRVGESMGLRAVGLFLAVLYLGFGSAEPLDCTIGNPWSAELNMSPDSLRAEIVRALGDDTSCAASLYGVGQIAYQNRRYEVASRAFREATIAWSESAKVWDRLGMALYRTRAYQESESAFRRALLLAPRQPEYYNHLGLTLLKQERHSDATAAYMAALGISPSYVEARYNLGQVYDLQGRTDVALREFSRAVKDDPRFVRGRYALAVLLKRMEDYDAAEAHLDTVIWFDPAFLDAHVERGFVALQRNGGDRAVGDFRHVLDARPDHARARYGLAVAYAFRRQWVAAQRQCDTLATVDSALASRLQNMISR